jgi:Holliday junction resolvase
MSTASRGAAREHAVKRLLESEGWAVTRGAGSHGCADLDEVRVPNGC